jgi:hypothetical protein
LNLTYDELLSNAAFNFNLRRYTLGSVVSWASAVIDAHFTTFAMEAGGGAAGAAMGVLRESAVALQARCAAVGRVQGALQHVVGRTKP